MDPFNALIIVSSQQFDYVLIFLFQRKLSRLRYGIFANRRTLAIVTGVLVAGGTVAYVQLHLRSRSMRSDSSVSHPASGVSKDNLIQNGVNVNSIKKATLKRGGLRSLHVLSAILLSQMGPMGMRNLLALVVTAVSLFFLFFPYSFAYMICHFIKKFLCNVHLAHTSFGIWLNYFTCL